jgi:hypothetical protein
MLPIFVPVIVAPPSDYLSGGLVDRPDANSEYNLFDLAQPKADQRNSDHANYGLLFNAQAPAVYSDYQQPIVAYAPA